MPHQRADRQQDSTERSRRGRAAGKAECGVRMGHLPLAAERVNVKRSDWKERRLCGRLRGRGAARPLRGGLGERLHVAGEHTPRWHIHMAVGEESWFLVPTGPLECPHGVAAGPLEQVTEEGQAGGSRVPRGSE